MDVTLKSLEKKPVMLSISTARCALLSGGNRHCEGRVLFPARSNLTTLPKADCFASRAVTVS
jgi:hypothetical protein